MSAGAISERKRIATEIRPTALENWIKLQREYDGHVLIADYQVSKLRERSSVLAQRRLGSGLGWLAVGLDPESGNLVIESLIPEHAELTTWLGWLLPLGMLERNPKLKAEMEAIEDPEDAATIGKSSTSTP